MKLSIIVPVYNVEQSIASCIDSLLDQNIPTTDYEIIIVNDGSPDRSYEIVETYAQKHKNIIHVRTKNGGPGAARNVGIDLATGKYIWFVDGDDSIASNCLKELLDYVNTNQLDICELPYTEVSKTDRKTFCINEDLKGKIVDSVTLIAHYHFYYAAWFFLLRKAILDKYHLRMPQGVFHEDLNFNVSFYGYCNRISTYPSSQGLYFYNISREGSTMTNKSVSHIIKRLHGNMKVIENICTVYKAHNNQFEYYYYMQRFANVLFLHHYISLLRENLSLDNQKTAYQTALHDYQWSFVSEVYPLFYQRFKYSWFRLVSPYFWITIFSRSVFLRIERILPAKYKT